jgi:glycosyltransferase involved in cell wall biosynthesis
MTRVCLAHGGDLSEPSGGTDRVSAFAAGLDDQGSDVTIVVPESAGTLPDRLDNIETVEVSIPAGTRDINQPVRAIRVARKAKQVARERGARLQIEHSTLAGVADWIGCSRYVLDMHDLAHASPLYGNLPFGTLVQQLIRRIEGRAIRNAAAIVTVTDRMADRAAAEWGVPRRRFSVIANGYFPEKVMPYSETETVAGRVVFLGTLYQKVNTDALVAIAHLPAVEELVVIGDGVRRTDLKQARDKNTPIRITGRLPNEEAFRLLASAAIAVNPQHGSTLQRASSPVKLYYYAALGRPMVLTEGPELADQLANVGAARLVSPGGDFGAAVQALISDTNHREAMADAAIAFGRKATWDRRIERMAEVHEVL